MSITISVIGGRYAPLVICDTCGKALSEPGMAVVVYNMHGKEDREPTFAHKGSCHDSADERVRAEGGLPGWSEFGTWMAQLLHNSGMDEDETARGRDSAAFLMELGI